MARARKSPEPKKSPPKPCDSKQSVTPPPQITLQEGKWEPTTSGLTRIDRYLPTVEKSGFIANLVDASESFTVFEQKDDISDLTDKRVIFPTHMWDALGKPNVITVEIEPGDRYNQ